MPILKSPCHTCPIHLSELDKHQQICADVCEDRIAYIIALNADEDGMKEITWKGCK